MSKIIDMILRTKLSYFWVVNLIYHCIKWWVKFCKISEGWGGWGGGGVFNGIFISFINSEIISLELVLWKFRKQTHVNYGDSTQIFITSPCLESFKLSGITTTNLIRNNSVGYSILENIDFFEKMNIFTDYWLLWFIDTFHWRSQVTIECLFWFYSHASIS